MVCTRLVLSLLILSAFGPTLLAKADDAAVRERLERAIHASSLDEMTARPWHATLDVTIFDAKGQNPVDATIEYWKSGAETRKVTTAGSATEPRVKQEG